MGFAGTLVYRPSLSTNDQSIYSGVGALTLTMPATGSSASCNYNFSITVTGRTFESLDRTISAHAGGSNQGQCGPFQFNFSVIGGPGFAVPGTSPGPPSITGVAPGNGSISVSFSPPSNPGSSPIIDYTAVCGTASASWNLSPITVTGLVNGRTYTCTVAARNSNGTGISSAPSGPVIPAAGASTHTLTISRSGGGSGVVTSSPQGINCGTVCGATFPSGAAVSLSASAATGSRFSGWSGDCNGTGAAAVTMTRNMSCTAHFSSTSTAPTSYQGLWWQSPAGSGSGWGLNLEHQGDVLFGTWFTYVENRKPMWFVIDARKQGVGVYSGPVYATTGTPVFSGAWNSTDVSVRQVGTATLQFSDANNALFEATVSGFGTCCGSNQWPITRQIFSEPVPSCSLASNGNSYQGLWWRSPAGSESGWGVNITQQGNLIFATWFTYGEDGLPLWLVMPAGQRMQNSLGAHYWLGDVYRTNGQQANTPFWDSSLVTTRPAGRLGFMFDDRDRGVMWWEPDGLLGPTIAARSYPITRQVFSSPLTRCQ